MIVNNSKEFFQVAVKKIQCIKILHVPSDQIVNSKFDDLQIKTLPDTRAQHYIRPCGKNEIFYASVSNFSTSNLGLKIHSLLKCDEVESNSMVLATPLKTAINIGDFGLVNVSGKKATSKTFLAQVITVDDKEFEVMFFKSVCSTKTKFVADPLDTSWVERQKFKNLNLTPTVDHRFRHCFSVALDIDV